VLPVIPLLLSILCIAGGGQGHAPASDLSRHDFYVDGEPGIHLFVREVSQDPSDGLKAGPAILLIHGARVPGVASFDLPVPGGSLAADLARRGFTVYLMDVRGYGKSTRPKEMEESPAAHSPLVRSNEAARDIAATVNWICNRQHVTQVALFGWATGGQWAGYYASLYPEKVSVLILLNNLYGGSSSHPSIGRGSSLEDPKQAGRFNTSDCGAYRLNGTASLFGQWDSSIPEQDKSLWRDPVIAKAFAEEALKSDNTSDSRTPPSFRSPCGALEDSFYNAIGRQLWDASLITAPTLILAGERDFWSRPADREALAQQLVHARRVKVVVIPGATHFVHLDRPERGRNQLLDEVSQFLNENRAP
jgi:pimeloyl-ACP methyl ester carboxylesterase